MQIAVVIVIIDLCALRQAYDRILLRSILQMSENVKQSSERLHNHLRYFHHIHRRNN